MPQKIASVAGLIIIAGVLGWQFMMRSPIPAQADPIPVTPTPAQGAIQLDIQTPGAAGRIAGFRIPVGQKFPMPGGVYRLTVSAPGYDTSTQTIEIQAGHITKIRGALVDAIPPATRIIASPSIAYTDETIRVEIWLQDVGSGLDSFHLTLDDRRIFDKQMGGQGDFRYTLPLVGMGIGLHQLEVRAIDALGNANKVSVWVEIDERPPDISQIILPNLLKNNEDER